MDKINLKAAGLLFLILVPLVILLESVILKPHLRYGFADVDWKILLEFKEIYMLPMSPIDQFLKLWQHLGIYTYQAYYIGLIERFFGIDYKNFQIITHIFKVMATLSIFPVILFATRSKMAAALTTIIYAVSYSVVGVMYTVSTSGLFVAIPVMSLFLVWYWRLINKGKNTFLEVLIGVFLFFSVLLLAADRMYPLAPSLFLMEFFYWFKNGYSKKVFFEILKRLSVFAIAFGAVFLFSRSDYTGFFGGNTRDTYNRLILGDWQVLIKPLTSFGSLFFPREYWKYFGKPNIDSFFSYIGFIISGLLFFFVTLSIFFSVFFSKRKRRFILITLITTFLFSILIYILSAHKSGISESLKSQFDIATIVPALIGSFVISLTFALFKEWMDSGKKDNLIISMIGGVAVSMIFILLTWFAADHILVFTGVHRYLAIPAIGSSLFIAGAITAAFKKLYASRLRQISYLALLLLIPLIMFNANIIGEYFKYELGYTGTDAAEHARMKNKLWSFLNNFSNTEPSIFYFDESADHDNGYFDETTVLAGFNFWMRFRGSDIVNSTVTPALLRSNLICPEPISMCLSKVKSLVSTQNGEKGLLYGTVFYKVDNFYAFRFVNKDIVDIKPEVMKAIGL
ncbi:MAG: hypothetical protein M1365_02130 [Actinobacteria bacterium]|nr:hypothetical protein [Actinomycetota bacterium]